MVIPLLPISCVLLLLGAADRVDMVDLFPHDNDPDSQSLMETSRTAPVKLRDCKDEDFNDKIFQLKTDKTWEGQNGRVYQASPPEAMNYLGPVAMKVALLEKGEAKFNEEIDIMTRVADVPHALHMLTFCVIGEASKDELVGQRVILMPWLPAGDTCRSAITIMRGNLTINSLGALKSKTVKQGKLDENMVPRALKFIKANVEFFCKMTTDAQLVDSDRHFDMGAPGYNTRHYNDFGVHNLICTLDRDPPYDVHPLHFDFGMARNLNNTDDKRILKMWQFTVGDIVDGGKAEVDEKLSLGRVWEPLKEEIRNKTGNGEIYKKYAFSTLCSCLKEQSHKPHVDRVKQALTVTGMQCV